MNLIGRIWKAVIDDYPEVPNTADTDDESEEVVMPWNQCRWVELTARCRCPLNDENMPSGCDAKCPARLAVERHARELEYENTERLFK